MRILFLLAILALPAACDNPGPAANNVVAAEAECRPLDAAEKAALRKLDQDYAAAWLLEGVDAQKEALMALFSENAVIIPGQGIEPKEGSQALEDFWFPADGSPTLVTSFDRDTSSIAGTNCLAAVTGRSEATWTYEGKQKHQVGNYLFLAEESAGGRWQIVRMIWNNRTIDDNAS